MACVRTTKKRTFFQKTKKPDDGVSLLLKGIDGAVVTEDSDFFEKRDHGENFFPQTLELEDLNPI